MIPQIHAHKDKAQLYYHVSLDINPVFVNLKTFISSKRVSISVSLFSSFFFLSFFFLALHHSTVVTVPPDENTKFTGVADQALGVVPLRTAQVLIEKRRELPYIVNYQHQ